MKNALVFCGSMFFFLVVAGFSIYNFETRVPNTEVRVEHADADVIAAMRLDINIHEEVVISLRDDIVQLQAEVGDLQQLNANTQDQINDLNNLIQDLQSHEEVTPKSHEGNRG